MKSCDIQMEDCKTSDLTTSSDLKSIIWKKRSYCELNKYHDMGYMYLQGHPYNEKLPEYIEVENNNEAFLYYPELTHIYTDDRFHKNHEYDIAVNIARYKNRVPVIGIEVEELSQQFPKGDLTYGLFVYDVPKGSVCHEAGLRHGDVIIAIQRPKLERTPSGFPRNHHYHLNDNEELEYDYEVRDTLTDNGEVHVNYREYPIRTISDMMNLLSVIEENEPLIFIIQKNEIKKVNGKPTSVPTYTKITVTLPFELRECVHIDNTPRILVKRYLPLEIRKDGYVYMYYDYPTDYIYMSQKDLRFDIDEEGNLVADIPQYMLNVKYNIEERQLIEIYE